MIVNTDKVMREADGPVGRAALTATSGGKVCAPGASRNRASVLARSPNITSAISGNFIYRHHDEPRVKLYSPREESFPIPLKYIDVSRTTHINLDVMQESPIDDYWNIDGPRDLSDSWTGFTQFTLLEEKPPDGYM